jgi:hypothetical protein
VEAEPQEPLLLALAEPKPECVPVPESDVDPDLTSNGIKKVNKSKMTGNFLGKNAASDMKRQDFVKKKMY